MKDEKLVEARWSLAPIGREFFDRYDKFSKSCPNLLERSGIFSKSYIGIGLLGIFHMIDSTCSLHILALKWTSFFSCPDSRCQFEITSLGWSPRFFSHRPKGCQQVQHRVLEALCLWFFADPQIPFILTISVVINTFFSSFCFSLFIGVSYCSLIFVSSKCPPSQVPASQQVAQKNYMMLAPIVPYTTRILYSILPNYHKGDKEICSSHLWSSETSSSWPLDQTAQRLSARRWTTLWTTQNCTRNCPHRKVRRLERLKILSRQCPTRQHFCSEHVFSRSDRMERGQVSGGPVRFRNSLGNESMIPDFPLMVVLVLHWKTQTPN